jgi:hypothetical protein
VFLFLQYYDCELSEVEDFEGFEEYFETFPLYRGKKTVENDDDDADNDSRLAGYFKVLLVFTIVECRTGVILVPASFLGCQTSSCCFSVKAKCYVVGASFHTGI